MLSFLYLICLMTALAGLLAVDYRWKIAWFIDRRATVVTVLIGVAFFAAWDVAGILGGVFFTGKTTYLSGIRFSREFPVEEIVFLTLLCYNTILAWRGSEKLCSRT